MLIGILFWFGCVASVIVAFQYRTIADLEGETRELRCNLGRERDAHAETSRHLSRPTLYSLDVPPGWHVFDGETADAINKQRGMLN